MTESLHKQLVEDTEELRDIVARHSTEEVAGQCSVFFLKMGTDPSERADLMSPARQIYFLLGLMLTTEEPRAPEPFDDSQWSRAIDLLNAIFGYYAEMFWPTEEDEVTERWQQVREVSMPAFLHYFNVSTLASVEQVRARIERYICPFDSDLSAEWGISGSEVLNVVEWLGDYLQKVADDLFDAQREEAKARHALLDEAREKDWDMDRIREEAQSDQYRLPMEAMLHGINSVSKVNKSDIRDKFGSETADRFWELMVSKRSEAHELQYLTEQSPAEASPLIETTEGVACCPSMNAVYLALLEEGERALLERGGVKQSFLRHRDDTLEDETQEQLKRLLGEDAEYWNGVYETQDLQYEHDLIVVWQNKLLIVEAKASPPIEPFRDPEKAFTRISRAFRSDSGIQKAFEQTERIRQQLDTGSEVVLYGGDRKPAVVLDPENIDSVQSVCVTRDDFGVLSVDLSLLLQKGDHVPYPWAVNILDLGTLANAYEYFGWGGDRLFDYLEQRERLHGRVIATDEMEPAGFDIQHGGLQFLLDKDEVDKFHVSASYSDVFDRIYEAQRGGEPVEYSPTEPYVTDMREVFAEVLGEEPTDSTNSISSSSRPPKKQGRNERCACGSGRKYKRCCGKP